MSPYDISRPQLMKKIAGGSVCVDTGLSSGHIHFMQKLYFQFSSDIKIIHQMNTYENFTQYEQIYDRKRFFRKLIVHCNSQGAENKFSSKPDVVSVLLQLSLCRILMIRCRWCFSDQDTNGSLGALVLLVCRWSALDNALSALHDNMSREVRGCNISIPYGRYVPEFYIFANRLKWLNSL